MLNADSFFTAKKCGCIQCLSIFPPNRIEEFWDSDKTDVCPFCGIDSVLFDSQGILITDKMLREVRHYAWDGMMDFVESAYRLETIEVD